MRAWLLWVTALVCAMAHADLFTAQTAYQRGDFGRAFKDYLELAELGQPTAQHNVAIMYLQGQGVRQSDLNAYAWATLAVESGDLSAQSLVEDLRPRLAPGSEKIAADIRAPYSRALLDQRLMPKVEEDGVNGGKCHIAKADHRELLYPENARRKGIQGDVIIELTVLADGSTRNPRVVFALPAAVFDTTARDIALRMHYQPPRTDAEAVHCHLMIRFQMSGNVEYPTLDSFEAATRKKALAGDVQAELTYGFLIAGLPQLHRPASEAVPWFLKAAQAGAPTGQYMVGASLLYGLGCQCEEGKAEVWLRRAAEADQPSAQVTLASFALRGSPDEKSVRIAATWLERAAASGDHDGMYYLAALLAATDVAPLRDPKRALALLEKLPAVQAINPTAVEVRAAALAALGNYAEAVKAQRHALSRASALHWDPAPLDERLARYQAQQPWYGNLLGL